MSSSIIIVISFLAACSVTSAMESQEAMNYMMEYGYMKKDTTATEEEMTKAFMKFQKYTGLKLTGTLDSDTIEMMQKPRCGLPDNDAVNMMSMSTTYKRKRRFSNYGEPWVTNVTYHIKPNYEKLKSEAIIEDFKNAFAMWAKYANLRFIEANETNAEIVASFETGDHGDGTPFYDNDKVLAHAYHPAPFKIGGDAHFKSTVNWITNDVNELVKKEGEENEETKYKLYSVAIHEFGHTLGIGHSEIREAVMFPYYHKMESFNNDLSIDDMRAVQHLYGKNPHHLCGKSTIDTMFKGREDFLVFIGDLFWVLPRMTYIEFPKKISEVFTTLPRDINAAFMDENDDYVFFKDHLVWKYRKADLVSGFPKRISEEFPGIPSKINAAFMWPSTKKYFFFKEGNVYGYDRNITPPVESRYPVPITNWEIPYPFDAAFAHNGMAYFIKNMLYYKLKLGGEYKLERGYPKSLGSNWFDC